MALATSALATYAAIGNREDLSDMIYNISPTDVPFLTSIGRGTADATLHEWQQDVLASASASNQVLEGDEATTDTTTPTTRIVNTCEIQDKVARVTGTQQAVKSAGRKDQLAYEIVKRAKELRRDMETDLTSANARNAGNATTARVSAGLETWYFTNTTFGSGGSTTATVQTAGAITGGTDVPLTEAVLKASLASAWDAGGDPDCIMVGSNNKQVISGFTGNATRMKGAEDKTLVAAVDIYDSDFGTLEIKPNRFQNATTVHILQTDMWEVAYLRPVRMSPLAKDGDSERKQILVEWTLVAKNQAASAAIFDRA